MGKFIKWGVIAIVVYLVYRWVNGQIAGLSASGQVSAIPPSYPQYLYEGQTTWPWIAPQYAPGGRWGGNGSGGYRGRGRGGR